MATRLWKLCASSDTDYDTDCIITSKLGTTHANQVSGDFEQTTTTGHVTDRLLDFTSSGNGKEKTMFTITEIARAFFKICEAGKGWDACQTYCTPDASFSAQAEPLTGIRTLREYADWMKGLLTFMPDGSYEVKSFATDAESNSVCVYAIFNATHTGQGGPCPPTGKSTTTDYVYVIQFEDDKIRHMTKIWNAGWAMKELGWA
jgi:predicted ester cyclase